jgi:RHS repeat-associated protein
MKRAILSCRNREVFWGVALATVLAATTADAQPAIPPTTRTHFMAAPVPFEQARIATQQAKRAPVMRPATTVGTATPPEIVELARALKNDPDLIYQYVHDNIEFSPLWGLLKGPVGTLLDGRGNSFDQAALMVALLNQASLANTGTSNVNFEFGQLNLTSAQLQSWLGVDSNPNSISGILGSGGIPGSVFGDGSVTMGHVWVSVSINGTAYVFDPAFKAHTYKTGIVSNLPGIMGYSQAQFVADGNATVTSTTVQNVNRTALRSDLATYAGNLASYIRTNLPAAGVSDVVGGGTIVPTPFANGHTVRQTTNPNQSAAPTAWASIPSEYYATLSVTLPGAAAQTFNSFEIYGHRLSIFFNASFVPTLYLDGAAVVSGSAANQGDSVPIQESVSVPWYTSADQSLTQYVSAETNQNGGSSGYVVQTGWDQVGRGMIEKHRKLLTQAINSGAAANSELVLGETVAMVGYEWLAQCAAQQRLADQLLGTVTQYFYGGGIAGEAVGPSIASPYVDLPLNFINTPARVNGGAAETPNSMAAFLDSSGTSSSFESTTLEQTQANVPGFTAASTVKLLDIAIQNNDTIFDINNGAPGDTQSTYTNTIRPQLVPNYNPGDLSTIDNYVASGFRVIAPLHGQIPIGSWTGVGFKTMEGSAATGFSYGEIISGGLQGGFGGVNDPPAILIINADGSVTVVSLSPSLANQSMYNSPGGNGNTVGDPLDHQKGSYLYRYQDLSVGPKAFPYGLSFERSYDSSAQGTTGPLGAGWTHNFATTAMPGSDGFSGMGESSPLSAVNSIVALYVSSDLVKGQALTGQSNLDQFVLETVVNHWFTDQLTQNVVNVAQGWTTEQFAKVADGTYAPQLGSASILDAPTGSFRYRTKSGITMSFNSSGQISSWTNAAGASVGYTYSSGLLSTVKNAATGRQLTLTYSGNLVSSVSDGSRSVSYGYTNGNLTTFTDALQQNTAYAYDTSGQQDTAGHLTQVFYPSHPANPFVTNFYDSLGRVKQQANANGNVTQTFFAGSRTEVDDPVGNSHVWYNDSLANTTAEIQDYGPAPHLNISTVNTYDVQGNWLTMTMPEGDVITWSYDSLFNPLTITHTARPGSPFPPQVKTYTYATPVAPLPNYEAPHTFRDPNGNTTTYSYSSTTGALSTISEPAVTKPGLGTDAPSQAFTYTAIGLPQTFQDAEGRITRYDYDATYADQLIKTTVDYGRLNLATQYADDGFGDVKSTADANGYTTTSTFDNLRRIVEVDAPMTGVVTTYSYFPDGQTKTITRKATVPEVTQFTYTPSDKVSVITDALGNTSTTIYDSDDRILMITRPVSAAQNRQRTLSYDALNRLAQTSDTTSGSPGQILESYSYTPNGHVASFADASGHSMSYLYDGLDRLSQTTFPDNSTLTNQSDANGNVLQVTTRSGQSIGFTYDALNRTITKTPQGEAAGTVSYGYDLTGRLLQASDTSSTTPYQIGYDTAGRPNSYTDQQGRNAAVVYDGVGNLTRLQWPANTNGTNAYFVTYQYDALNRATEMDENGSAASPLAKYQWDSLSRLTLISYGDGSSDAYSQYDAGDNLQTLAESLGGGQNNVTFSYSWLKNHQRQSAAVNNGAFQYVPSTGTIDYAAANANNGYTSSGSTNFTYDGNRNLTFDGSNTLTYDVENRIVTAENGVAEQGQYLYDPLGHRKQKQVSGVATQYVLAGDDEIADFVGTGAGTQVMLTVRGIGGLPVAAITPAAGSQPETAVYYHHDLLGSTVAATQSGASGAVPFTYSEFGIPGAGDALPYKFAAYRYDAETGLYYVGARYYSPELGRFLQTDPIQIAGGTNLYAYASNDPLNLIDPTGLDTQITIGYTHTPVPGEYHEVVILTDTVTGQQYATRAGPESQSFSGSASNSSESSSGGSASASGGYGGSGGFGFGQIVAQTGTYGPTFRDPPSSIVTTQNVGTIPVDFSQAVADANNFASVTNSNTIPYWPLGPNSNAYASTFVESLTGTRPTPILSTPGWDMGSPSPNLTYGPTSLVPNSPKK